MELIYIFLYIGIYIHILWYVGQVPKLIYYVYIFFPTDSPFPYIEKIMIYRKRLTKKGKKKREEGQKVDHRLIPKRDPQKDDLVAVKRKSNTEIFIDKENS